MNCFINLLKWGGVPLGGTTTMEKVVERHGKICRKQQTTPGHVIITCNKYLFELELYHPLYANIAHPVVGHVKIYFSKT